MGLANDALLRARGTLEEIAEAVGYKTASALSTAFSRRVGSAIHQRIRVAHSLNVKQVKMVRHTSGLCIPGTSLSRINTK